MGDHVHMLISIPPKYSVSQVVGYIKGKSAIRIARTYAGRRNNFVGQSFWARGYFVSTVGRDEETVKKNRSLSIDHIYILFGAQYRAYILDPVRLRTPVTGIIFGPSN